MELFDIPKTQYIYILMLCFTGLWKAYVRLSTIQSLNVFYRIRPMK